jgi:hypothetical protein
MQSQVDRRLLECRYLGLYATEIEAAAAYDRESVARRGIYAVTNFDLSEYLDLLSESQHLATHAQALQCNQLASGFTSDGSSQFSASYHVKLAGQS